MFPRSYFISDNMGKKGEEESILGDILTNSTVDYKGAAIFSWP